MDAGVAVGEERLTGERFVPGVVESDLWIQHISRYRFASLFAHQKRVVDLCCGTGYGTELLAADARVALGLDAVPEAISYAAARFATPRFVASTPGLLPFLSDTFDLATAFEVFEPLDQWHTLIEETARVLTPKGIFLVSTPNNTSYAKAPYARAHTRVVANGFRAHDFTLEEFQGCLKRHFSFVYLLVQNSQETIVISADTALISRGAFVPAVKRLPEGHLFLAVCSKRPVSLPSLSCIPSPADLLREREIYIDLAKRDVAQPRPSYVALLDAHHRTETAYRQLKDARSQLEAAKRSVDHLLRERELVRRSFWLRIGRVIGIGPWTSRAARLRAMPRSFAHAAYALVAHLLLYIASPAFLFISAVALAAEDLCFRFFGKQKFLPETAPRIDAATIVIPNWNGHNLLKQFLPFLMAAVSANPANEVIVVDDASTDKSVEFLRTKFPSVRVIQSERKLGFAQAANSGVRQAKNDIVVLLNNDMRVDPDFLRPLLRGFTDPLVFAVSSQIFLSDTSRPREETGLTEVWWAKGRLRVAHRADPNLNVLYPCAYAGGGSSAFDRRKFLELGGFDSLFHPFYYEDTDLGLLAWKRGWKVLYQPASVVYHEHRGTIGKTFTPALIDQVVKKNALLYCWKNIHDWKILASNFSACLGSCLKTTTPKYASAFCTPKDLKHVFFQLAGVMRSRWQALSRRKLSDREAFRRPLGGYFRDRFLVANSSVPERLNVLFAAPYPIEPPVHGGAVFMKEALTRLSSVADVHLVSLVDFEEQLSQQHPLSSLCASAVFMRRPYVPRTEDWTLVPFAVREFAFRDFAWIIHRTIYTRNIDVIQLEYTNLGQYAEDYKYLPCMLFEHDVAFQALWRRIKTSGLTRLLLLEYLRLRRYEPKLLQQVTRVQVCTRSSADYLQRLVPKLNGRIDSDLRAGIDVSRYNFVLEGRQADTLLFVGTFRHLPNVYALTWFVQEVLPLIVNSRPDTLLIIVGSDPPSPLPVWMSHPNVRLLGSVADVRIPLERYCAFVCPIRSGSGIRVKLLEAFASGIPVVSTTIGAEGLTSESGHICEIADTPASFAAAALRLLQDEAYRRELALRARTTIEREKNSKDMAVRLEAVYRAEVSRMREPIPAER